MGNFLKKLVFVNTLLATGGVALAGTIVTDGTFGHGWSKLTGPNYAIGPQLGKVSGPNLFQSFQQFDLARGDVATFTGPMGISNVLARITGGGPSMIDGTVQCNIPGANFYLINPSGVIFGPGAQLNVKGSFAVTTADTIRLGTNGKGQFRATDPGASVLTTAPPSAFGFLQHRPAPVTIKCNYFDPISAILQVKDGPNVLSVVARGINATNGQLEAFGGTINLISVGSPGTVLLNPAGIHSTPTFKSFSRLGFIELADDYVSVDDSTAASMVTGAGRINIRARSSLLNDGTIVSSEEYGAANGGSISIGLTERLTLDGGSSIQSATAGTGNCGSIYVKSASVLLQEESDILQTSGPSPTTSAATGATGNIFIYGGSLVVQDQSFVESQSMKGGGLPGGIGIHCGNVTVNGNDETNSGSVTNIQSFSYNTNPTGSIAIESQHLSVLGSGEINTGTYGPGNAGDISITSNTVIVNGHGLAVANYYPTAISSNAEPRSAGHAGDITIDAGSLQVLNFGSISSKTFSPKDAGAIDITAADIVLDGSKYSDTLVLTGLSVATNTSAAGGSINVNTGTLEIYSDAFISAASHGTGPGGDIRITATGPVKLPGGTIRAMSDESSSGSIFITTPDLLHLQRGTINTMGTAGGDITIDPAGVVLRDHSSLDADAPKGTGGSIQVVAHVYDKSSSSSVTAIGMNTETAGKITINGSDQDLVGSLTPLPINLGTPQELQDCCGATALAGSSFTLAALGAPAPEADGWSSGFVLSGQAHSVPPKLAQALARGDYDAGRKFLTRKIDLVNVSSDFRELVGLLGARGTQNTLAGAFAAADSDLHRAFEIAFAIKDAELVAEVLNAQGNLLLAQRQYAEAITVYSDGLKALGNTHGSPSDETACSLEINRTLAALASGKSGEAYASLQPALSLLQGLPWSQMTGFLNVAAASCCRQLCDVPAQADRDRLINQARTLLADTVSVSRIISDPEMLAVALGQWGALEELSGDKDAALDLTRRAVVASQQKPYLLYRWEWQRASILEDMGRKDESLLSLQRAVDDLTPAVCGALAAPGGNRTAAFRAAPEDAVRTGSSSFREDVGPLFFKTADMLLSKSAEQASPAQQQELLAKARDVIEQLKGAEVQDYLKDPCVPPPRPIGALEPHSAVIYIVPLADRTELLVELSDGLHRFISQVSAEEVATHVRDLRSKLEDISGNEYRTPAGWLYQNLIIEKLESLLEASQVRTLVFVPDGALRSIPMAALCYGEHNEHFLIEKYAIAVSPGLRLMDHKVDSAPGQTLLGGLSQASGYAPLENVPAEIAAVAAVYPGRTLMNQQFRLDTLRNALLGDGGGGQYSIVHLATHGHFGATAAETYLVTSSGNLTLGDLQAMIAPSRTSQHPVELLTLSACETAKGDDQAALGLAGIAVKSGARTSVATLWCVSDEASVQLMQAFYKAMSSDRSMSKARAMQIAQLHICNAPGYRHPFYWAPYLVIGNWL